MQRQLALIEQEPAWRLDDEARSAGRAGIAQARLALSEALRRQHDRVARPASSGRSAA